MLFTRGTYGAAVRTGTFLHEENLCRDRGARRTNHPCCRSRRWNSSAAIYIRAYKGDRDATIFCVLLHGIGGKRVFRICERVQSAYQRKRNGLCDPGGAPGAMPQRHRNLSVPCEPGSVRCGVNNNRRLSVRFREPVPPLGNVVAHQRTATLSEGRCHSWVRRRPYSKQHHHHHHQQRLHDK